MPDQQTVPVRVEIVGSKIEWDPVVELGYDADAIRDPGVVMKEGVSFTAQMTDTLGHFVQLLDQPKMEVKFTVTTNQKRETCYVCGPMTGYPDYNYPLFNEVTGHLRDLDVYRDVLNPAHNFGGDQSKPREVYLRMAAQQVSRSDVLCLLPNWHESKGALMEVHVALQCGCRFVNRYNDPLNTESVKMLFTAAAAGASLFGTTLIEDAAESPAVETILEEAQRLVHGDRQRTYGHPIYHHTRTAEMWTAKLRPKLKEGEEIKPYEVADLFKLDKMIRAETTPDHRDSHVDQCGYTAVQMMVIDKMKEQGIPL